MPSDPIAQLQLADLAQVIRRRILWVLVPLIAVVAAAAYLSTSAEETYEATAQVLLSDSAAQVALSSGSQNTSFRNRLLENEIRLARSDEALSLIARDIGVDFEDVPEFDVAADSLSDVLEFSSSQLTPEGAATLANVAAQSYVEVRGLQAQSSIQSSASRLEDALIGLQTERDELRANLIRLETALLRADDETRPAAQAAVDLEESQISGPVRQIDAQISATSESLARLELSGDIDLSGTARIVSAASPPLEPSNPPLWRNLLLGVIAGGFVGLALALVRESQDDKIRTLADIESLGLITLGAVPAASRKINRNTNLALASLNDPSGVQAQAHIKVQSTIKFLTQERSMNSVLITSAVQGEGKTTMASNLALNMAQSFERTVLADLDLRRPRVHRAFGLPQDPGLSSVVLDGADIGDCSTRVSGFDEYLAILPAGPLPPNPATLINSASLADVAKMISKLSDFAILDAPPVLPVADTLTLARLADGVILVAYGRRTKKADLLEAVRSLSSNGVDPLGVVLLGAERKKKSAYRYEASSPAKA